MIEIDDNVVMPPSAKAKVAAIAQRYRTELELTKTNAAKRALAEDTSGAFSGTDPASAVQYIARRIK